MSTTSQKVAQKFSSTFYTQQKKKQSSQIQQKTPPKNQIPPRKINKCDLKKKLLDNQLFQQIKLHQKDERFRYLLKHGQLKKIQKNGNIIFSQLSQIPDVWVCYRRPCQRQSNIDRLNLDSLQLTHIPLLQGQQKLQILTFQHNLITKLQNLISLNSLIYIDLFDNQIKQIQNLFQGIPSLKVLLLPKNHISKIKNIQHLIKLQVLDLNNNKISKIQGIHNLNSLRILNLAYNQISKIQNLGHLTSLIQLNLRNNLIQTAQNLKTLSKLQKLYLSHNRIQLKFYQNSQLPKLTSLKQLTLQNNPCSKDRTPYLRSILKHLPFLKTLDGKPPTLSQQPDITQQGDHGQVLKLIASQWQQQKKRIQNIQQLNGSKRQFLKTTMITGGHAQIQDQNMLFIYGNSYQVVLTDNNFQQTVQKIRFQFIFIEFLIQQNMLNTLKKFKKLKSIQFSQNYIISLLQIAKLQNLTSLKSLSIQSKDNPITTCTFLKQFIIYRYPSLTSINRQQVKQLDRNKAKILFQNFDKTLQIPQKIFGIQSLKNYPSEQPNEKKDRNYLKNFYKIINEQSQQFLITLSQKAQHSIKIKLQTQKLFDQVILMMIKNAQIKDHLEIKIS